MDSLFKRCLELAKQSKEEREHYGSILLINDRIVGEGYNHTCSSDEAIQMLPICHGEIAAIGDALGKGHDVRGSNIFVAGYFIDNGEINIPEQPIFTCLQCPPYLKKYGIGTINLYTKKGWVSLCLDDAIKSAEDFQIDPRGHNTVRRRQLGSSGVFIDDVMRK